MTLKLAVMVPRSVFPLQRSTSSLRVKADVPAMVFTIKILGRGFVNLSSRICVDSTVYTNALVTSMLENHKHVQPNSLPTASAHYEFVP